MDDVVIVCDAPSWIEFRYVDNPQSGDISGTQAQSQGQVNCQDHSRQELDSDSACKPILSRYRRA